jgi:hypothetical protein
LPFDRIDSATWRFIRAIALSSRLSAASAACMLAGCAAAAAEAGCFALSAASAAAGMAALAAAAAAKQATHTNTNNVDRRIMLPQAETARWIAPSPPEVDAALRRGFVGVQSCVYVFIKVFVSSVPLDH